MHVFDNPEQFLLLIVIITFHIRSLFERVNGKQHVKDYIIDNLHHLKMRHCNTLI